MAGFVSKVLNSPDWCLGRVSLSGAARKRV